MSLHDAVKGADIDSIKKFIEDGVDINIKDRHMRTAAHLAAHVGNLAVLKLLIELNADFTIKANDNFTPLHFAAIQGHSDCVKAIARKNKGIINAKISKGAKTALHLAAHKGHFQVVKTLVELKADISSKTSSGQTAADLASSEDIRKYLLQTPEERLALDSVRNEEEEGELEAENILQTSKRQRIDS